MDGNEAEPMQATSTSAAFFFESHKRFSEEYAAFVRYLQNVGLVSSETLDAHGKDGIRPDRYDDLLDWDFIRDRDVQEMTVKLQQEVIAIALALNVSEAEIESKPLADYYTTVSAAERHFKELNKRQNETD